MTFALNCVKNSDLKATGIFCNITDSGWFLKSTAQKESSK